jgi:hypothetical protein
MPKCAKTGHVLEWCNSGVNGVYFYMAQWLLYEPPGLALKNSALRLRSICYAQDRAGK